MLTVSKQTFNGFSGDRMKRFSRLLILLILTAVNGRLWAFGGTVPAGLPTNFGYGTIDKNDNWGGDVTGPHRWKIGQGTTCWDYSYQYLTNGWRTWSAPDGQWPVNELSLWEANGQNQVFTFYYNNGAASLPAGWFTDLMILMQKIQANATKKVIIHFEPDFLGFCIQKGAGSYNSAGIVKVGSDTMPTGWTGSGTKAWNTANYPDTLVGWAKAIRDMQTLVAPTKVLIAHHVTAWGASSGSSGDAFGQPTSQADIDSILTQITTFMKNIGGGSTSYMDLFFMDPSDRDAGFYNQANGGSNLRWSAETYTLAWGTRSWATLAYVADKTSALMGQRCMFWQMPNGNHFYKLMTNTDGHYQDNYAEAFLPSTSANGASGSPGDAISAVSTTTGPGFWANHGLIGVLFGEGYYAGNPPEYAHSLTHLRDYGPADGVGTPAGFVTAGGPGQGQATNAATDNDAGYLRTAVAKYCSVGKFPLPGVGTPTFTPTTCACSPTFTPTATRTPIPPADCPLVLNTCDSLTANGTWAGVNGSSALNSNATFVTSGNSIKFTVATAVGFQDKVSVLSTFAPSNWSSFDRISFDLYVDPANPLWTGTSAYNQFQLRLTNATAAQYEVDNTGATALPITTGWNHLSFPLSWAIVNPVGISSLFLVPSVGTAAAGAIYYIDNIVLHTDLACPTSTPTPTFNPNTATPSPTPTRTPADCPLVLNDGESLTSNGFWTSNSGTAAVNSNALYATSGNSIKFTVTSPASFQDKVSVLGGFTPSDWRSFDRLTFDLYVDPANPLWTGASIYQQFQVRVTNSTAAQYEVDPTGATAPPIVTGWNHLTFPLSWATVNGNGIVFLFLIPAVGTPAPNAVYYIDNVVLHTDNVCPPPTATSTVTPSYTLTRTVTPSATPSYTSTLTRTPTASPSQTTSPSVTPTNTALANTATWTPTRTGTSTYTGTATYSATPTWTATPSNTPLANTSTYTATRTSTGTYTVTATVTATPSNTALANTATFTATRSGTPTLTASPSNTALANTATHTPTVTLTGTPSMTSTYTVTPSRTATPTFTATPSITATATNVPPGSTATMTSTISNTFTRSATPSNTVTSSNTATPSFTATLTATRTASSSATFTGTLTLSPVPTATHTPVVAATSTSTFTNGPSATFTPTYSSTVSGTPTRTATGSSTVTVTLTSSSTLTRTSTPSSTATLTASPTVTVTFTNVPPGSTSTDSPTTSPSFTASPVNTATMTPLNTATATPVNTATSTAVSTATHTPVNTPSSTAVSTLTNTPASTVASTSTVTPANTLTSTAVSTSTNTPVNTPTNTPGSTSTSTVVSTAVSTALPTVTSTATPVVPVVTSASGASPSTGGGWTITVTGSNFAPGAQIIFDGVLLPTTWGGPGTLTATAPAHAAGTVVVTAQNPGGFVATGSGNITIAGPVGTFTATPASTPGPDDGTLEIEEHHAWPNPISGGSGHIGVKVKGRSDKITVKVYTDAMVCIGTRVLDGDHASGWVNVDLPEAFVAGSSNGLFYYHVSVERGSVKALKNAVGRVVVAR